jgi:hypothetical protein
MAGAESPYRIKAARSNQPSREMQMVDLKQPLTRDLIRPR